MPIRTPSGFSAITDNDQDEILICDKCGIVGAHSVLGERVYPNGDTTPEEERANWKQCYRCGKVFEIYNVRGTTKLKPFREPITDPFSTGTFNSLFPIDPKSKPSYNIRKIKVSEMYDDEDDEITYFKSKGYNVKT